MVGGAAARDGTSHAQIVVGTLASVNRTYSEWRQARGVP